jgi:hypothetical protein
MRTRDCAGLVGLLLVGCSPAGPAPTPYSGTNGTLTAGTLGETGSNDQTGDSAPGDGDSGDGDGDPGDGDGDPSDSGPKLDVVGEEASADDGPLEEGCEKVDFLFVVDNSLSMGDEQNNLEASFPEFIATIQSDVVADYHVMVVDTDNQDKWDEELFECHDSKCDGEDPGEECGVIPPQDEWLCGMLPSIDQCDPVLGVGVDHDDTDDRNSCNIAGGKRWFDDQQPNVGSTFSCIANLYEGNNPEQTMLAVTEALEPDKVGPGGCNQGFLRDDAVLVVTFISDEEDDTESPGNPQVWHDTLLALKGGNETAIVVLGLLGDTGLPNAICPPDSVPGSNGGEYSPRLIEYVDSWGSRGLWGSVCSPNYGPFFEQAVALIDMACEEYEPVG